MVGISKSALCNMENGKQIPNLKHIELIAKAFHLADRWKNIRPYSAEWRRDAGTEFIIF